MDSTNKVWPGTARDMVCPMSFDGGEYSTCRADACMAWRFVGELGYCGMAGPIQTPTDELIDKFPLVAMKIKGLLP